LICPECQTTNREEANFCRRCGRLLVDHCPRCGISLLADSDFCDHCGRPLSPAATLGWATGGDHAHTNSGKHANLARIGTPSATQETHPAEIGAKASARQQWHSLKAPQLDRLIPEELREKLNAARSKGEMVGERRIVTMLFCDVKGSTAAAEHLDPEEWTEIINGAFEHMITPVYKYEGTVARLMGDGILAFFGAPITHEDDPQRAVLAGLDIVKQISAYAERINRSWGIDINVRVGINTGLVVVGTVGSDLRMEYSAMGDAINLAARMEQTAEPGTVQIAGDTYKLVRPLFEITDLGGITIKGKAEPVPAYKVLGRKATAGRQRGIEGLHATLVGREHELATLQDILSTVQHGVGHIVCVMGEAGLGKSRLIHEAKRTIENGQAINWIETASLSYETRQPYAAFQRLIRRLNNMSPGDSAEQLQESFVNLGHQLDESLAHQAQRVFEALFDLESDGEARLEGEAFKSELYEMMPALWRGRFSRQPTVLVFEDMHWSDPASIELLLHLFPLTAEIPLVLVCAFRPERSGPVWRIKTTAEEEFRHLYTETTVRPLSDKQVNALIDGLLINTDIPQSLRARILESAGGNPFFVEEVVRSLIDNQALVSEEIEQDGQNILIWRAKDSGRQIEIPDSLQSLLSSRIDRLEEETRQLLQTAAVIGRSFYRRVLEAIEAQSQESAGVIERQLNMLLQLEMIQEAARLPELEYRFSNPLTQEVAYQTILLKRRRDLHLRVGQTLEELFPDQLGELASLLAHHFAEGDLREKAFDYYLMAGNSAARLFANIEALDHYTRALELIKSVDPSYDDLEALYTGRGRALELLARYEDSLENYESMLQLAQDRDDKRLELTAKMAQATIHSIPSKVFDPEISQQLSKDARILAQELGDSSAEAKISWNLMLHYLWATFQFDQAVEHGEAAVEVARDSNLTVELGPILNDLALAYYGVGRLEESVQTFEESRIRLRDGHDLPLLALNLTNSSTIQFLIGNSEPAQLLMEEAERINRSIENSWGLAGSLYYRGSMHLINGGWGEALTALNESIKFCEMAQAEMLLAVSLLAKANYSILVGATESGFSLCRRAMKLFDKHLPFFQGYPWGLMSQLHLVAEDQSSAREALQNGLANLDLDYPPTPTFSSIEVRVAEIKLRLADGQPDLAAARAADLLDYLKRFHVRQFVSDALLLKAKALLALDQPKEANDLLEDACRQAEELSTQPTLWLILDSQADALERIGDPDQAASKREQAHAILATLADSIIVDEDRATFLNLPDVRRLLQD
jgi:class 3 adenylate cyclase/tetratricopeptide (TPR) repeat protein